MLQKSEVAASAGSSSPPDPKKIEARTREIGQQIFEGSHLSKLDLGYWKTKILDIATRDARVKTQLFRFVDVLPVLKTRAQRKEHLREYLSPQGSDWPIFLSLVAFLLKIPIVGDLVVLCADFQVSQMAKTFILGRDSAGALPKVLRGRSRRLAFTLDILGEAVFSEEEAQNYFERYLELIEELGKTSKSWVKDSQLDESDLGAIPAVNVSIKVSSLDCHIDPSAFEESIARLQNKIRPLLEAAVKHQVFINFDMEQFETKDLIRELFKRLIMEPAFKNYRYFGIVNQAYLTSALDDTLDWIEFAKKMGTPFTIRLVKGAYWDYETILADQNAWKAPVFLKKYESDVCFEACAKALLDAYPHIEVAVGSHNIRSIAYALAYREALGLPKNAMEIQMLYGMADPFKHALIKMGIRVREYDPVGEMLPGLSYLVRRLLENSSNDSFLKQSFLEKTAVKELLINPQLGERS